MPEFLTLLPPDEARALLLSQLQHTPLLIDSEVIDVSAALGRVLAEDINAPHPRPEFERSTVDGYAVRARDTHGASDSLPAYLNLIGEVPMGASPAFQLDGGQCALIHTGGMLPEGADAVVMLEYTQSAHKNEIEIFRAVADGENLIRIGEDVAEGQTVQARGSVLRPSEVPEPRKGGQRIAPGVRGRPTVHSLGSAICHRGRFLETVINQSDTILT